MTNFTGPGDVPATDARTRESGGPDARAASSEQKDLFARAEELAELVTHLQLSAEAERSALAKELHDELGGLITAAKMDMAWLSAHIGKSLDAAGEEKFRSVVQMLNQAMMLKRRVVENLRPSLLDHFGLPVALRSHFDEQCGRAGLEYIATLPEETLELTPAVQLALFRVAQEALASVMVRGTAKHVELVIEADDAGYSMLIGDDGTAQDEKLSQALMAIRHRVESAGGKFDSEIVDGQGNRIRVFVPRCREGSG
jgi:signal transduction histidine kinase